MPVDKAVLDRVIKRALGRGGSFADVYIENRVSRDILMEEGRFKSAEVGISQGAGVRVIVGDKTGYAYTDEITEEKMLRAAEVASYIARGTASPGSPSTSPTARAPRSSPSSCR